MNIIQKRILEIYKEIKKVCDAHNIEFCSIGGTTLGAVRHNGFIPWDDDLDIAIKIEDFETFVNVCRECLPDWLEVFIPGETKHWGLPFIKIMDNRTMMTCSSEMSYKDCYTGIFVDVMILHGMPRYFKQLKSYIGKMGFLVRAQSAVKQKFSLKTPLPHILLWVMTRPVSWFCSKDFYWKKFLKFLQTYQIEGSRYVADTGGMFVFPHSWFAYTKKMPFENTIMKVPIGYDGYLTMVYGDYMQLPPEEKRTADHIDSGGILDLNKSYKEYVHDYVK